MHLLTAAARPVMDACVNKSGHCEQSHANHCDACVVLDSSPHKLASQLYVSFFLFTTLGDLAAALIEFL